MKKLIFILTFLLCSVSAEAATKFVDNNSTGGCTNGATNYTAGTRACGAGSSTVYLTLQAVATNLEPGDIVETRGGTAYPDGITCTLATGCDSGTVGLPITFRSYLSETVTVNASMFHLFNSDIKYWIAEDIIVDLNKTGSQGICYQLTGNTFATSPDFITVSGGSCLDTESDGILMRGEGHHIDGVTFQNNGNVNTTPQQHAIYVTGQSKDIIIENCTITNPAAYGIHIYDPSNSAASDGIIRYNTITNVPNNVQSQGGIMMGADEWHVYSNLIYDFVASDINTYGIEVRYGTPNLARVYNNTILMAGTGVGILVSGAQDGSVASNTTLQNNIVMGGGSRIVNNGTDTICSTNLTSDSTAIGCATDVDTAANTWTNSAADDFTLKQGSKAIGTGVDLSGTIQNLDINGATRTVPWDLGAIKAPVTPTLTLLTPNGGNLGQTGSMQTFTWSRTDEASVPNVRLLYDAAYDGTFNATSTLSATTTNDGSFDFTAPAVTTTGRFRVEDVVDGVPFDESDANVTITPSAGGTITWIISNNTSGTYQGNIGGVTSALLGESTPDFNFGISSGIRANKFGAGSHTHSVLKFPTNSILSNAIVIAAEIRLYRTADNATVGATSIDFRNNKRAFVQNEATWTIYSTGNAWGTPGGLAATDRDSAVVCNMSIPAIPLATYYTCSNAALTALVQNWVDLDTPNNGLHLERNGTGNDGLVRTFGAENPTAAYLSITYTTSTPTITLTSPISGAHFFPGKFIPIHWQSQGISGNVRILMSPNAGISYTEIEDSHPFGQVDFIWQVPPMQSSSSVVFKVESLNDPAVSDVSDAIRIGGRRTGLKQ